MEARAARDVTALLMAWRRGERRALDDLMDRVYPPLRRIAANQLRRERSGGMLETAALVNETFLRLVDQHRVAWRDRVHFFAIAARVMRRVLVDHARRAQAAKRGGGTVFVGLAEAGVAADDGGEAVDLLALEDALEALAEVRPTWARLVELRFFAGLTKVELATALDIAPATVTRRWRLARAWLFRFLEGEPIDVG